jgi:hypothetical protein
MEYKMVIKNLLRRAGGGTWRAMTALVYAELQKIGKLKVLVKAGMPRN